MGKVEVDEVYEGRVIVPDYAWLPVQNPGLHIQPGCNGKLALEKDVVGGFNGTGADISVANWVPKCFCFVIGVEAEVNNMPKEGFGFLGEVSNPMVFPLVCPMCIWGVSELVSIEVSEIGVLAEY